MSHATVILDTRTVKKDGTHPVKIRIRHKGSFYINTEVSVTEEQWAVSENRGILSGAVVNHTLASRYNALISSRKLEIDKRLIALTDGRTILKMDNAQLKEHLLQDDAAAKKTTRSRRTMICTARSAQIKTLYPLSGTPILI